MFDLIYWEVMIYWTLDHFNLAIRNSIEMRTAQVEIESMYQMMLFYVVACALALHKLPDSL